MTNWRLFSNPFNPATKLSGGPKVIAEKLAKAPREFVQSKQGTQMATRALKVVEQQDPDQADAFLIEIVHLGYNVKP